MIFPRQAQKNKYPMPDGGKTYSARQAREECVINAPWTCGNCKLQISCHPPASGLFWDNSLKRLGVQCLLQYTVNEVMTYECLLI